MFVITTNSPDRPVYGPFPLLSEAQAYAKKHCAGCCWRVILLLK